MKRVNLAGFGAFAFCSGLLMVSAQPLFAAGPPGQDEAEPLMPFAVQTAGGVCNTSDAPSANPVIVIDNAGDDPFVVTSILVKTAPQDYGEEGYQYLAIISLEIDGTQFDTFTSNLTAAIGGYGVQESADLMGTPISRNADLKLEAEKGGNFPHQIVADADGSDDIRVMLFCRADDYDLSIETVRVSGWKAASDDVSVTYIPGN